MARPIDRITFNITAHHGVEAVVPVINGLQLTDIVHDFERACGWTPENAYGGLIPAFFKFGPMADHYRGVARDHGLEGAGGTPVLGCECGEWGCWPLMVTASSDDQFVMWSYFRQPHRPEQRYDGIGPFHFDRRQYDESSQALSSFDR